jgi:hypothetical protein
MKFNCQKKVADTIVLSFQLLGINVEECDNKINS